jgi:disulfide bond formation protein DsbB
MVADVPETADAAVWQALFVAWLIAASATLGALFFGEVVKLPTCVLCWYQRIFMFPLAVILPLGLFPLDRKLIRYGLALAVPGLLLAVFHQLLVAGVIPESIQPCTQGVPCSQTVAVWFGFVTIPLLSAAAFSAIIVLLLAARARSTA